MGTEQWLFDDKTAKLSYQFYFASKDTGASSGIYQLENGQSQCIVPVAHSDLHQDESDDVMKDQVVSMNIDCNDWTLQFYYKDAQIGTQICIQKDTTYYAAILYNGFQKYSSIVSCCCIHSLNVS